MSERASSQVGVLFEPTDLGPLRVANRLVVAPMTRISADEDGNAGERHALYYGRFARGGFGTVITEGIHPDDDYSQGYHYQPGLATQGHLRSWARAVAAVHDAGPTAVVAQLMHAGAQSQGSRYRRGDDVVGPSTIAPPGEQLAIYRGSGPFPAPRALTIDEIRAVRHGFVAAARRARDAGFDGVELHGANGYLLDQFLTDYMNRREDRYGGEVGHRARLLVEVCDDVLQAVGNDLAVGVRLSQAKVSDQDHRWVGAGRDARVIVEMLTGVGVHWIHTTEPDATRPAFADDPRTLAQHAVGAGARRLIVNGDLGDPTDAVDAVVGLGPGRGDLVSLGRAALADPSWPERVRAGFAPQARFRENLLRPLADIKDDELAASS